MQLNEANRPDGTTDKTCTVKIHNLHQVFWLCTRACARMRIYEYIALLTYCIHSFPWWTTRSYLSRRTILTRCARISFLAHFTRISLDALRPFWAAWRCHAYLDIFFLQETCLAGRPWSASVTLIKESIASIQVLLIIWIRLSVLFFLEVQQGSSLIYPNLIET